MDLLDGSWLFCSLSRSDQVAAYGLVQVRWLPAAACKPGPPQPRVSGPPLPDLIFQLRKPPGSDAAKAKPEPRTSDVLLLRSCIVNVTVWSLAARHQLLERTAHAAGTIRDSPQRSICTAAMCLYPCVCDPCLVIHCLYMTPDVPTEVMGAWRGWPAVLSMQKNLTRRCVSQLSPRSVRYPRLISHKGT
jgi:hypothetical protein